MTTELQPFELEGVAHLIRPWGQPAADLEQLRRGIESAPPEVLFYHAVQYQLRNPGADELPPDDFSAWIGGVVQDAETAERLSFVVQGNPTPAESLRSAILEILNAVPEKRRIDRDPPEGSAFLFLSATSLRYPIGAPLQDGEALVEALLSSDPCVWFFHLIEDPWFGAGRATLPEWARRSAPTRLAGWLEEAAAGGLPIDKARAQLGRRWRRSQIGRRMTDAAIVPQDVRREAGREAVARLLRRRPRDGDAA